MFDRQVENDATADGASHHNRLVEFQCAVEGADDFGVAIGGKPVFLVVPAIRRIGFSMPGQVEGQHTEMLSDLGVV